MGENGLLEKVKQAITSNTTVNGLMRDLQDAGIKVKNELEAVILAEEFWWEINERECGPIEKYQQSELKELPGTTIKNNGIEYRIHGIVHGGRGAELSAKTINFVKEAVSKFSNPKEKEDYLCEPGLARTFGLENTKEIEETRLSPYLTKSCFRTLFDTVTGKIKNMRRAEKVQPWITEKNVKIAETMCKTIKNIEYLSLLREVYRRGRFPMPLDIEIERLRSAVYAAICDKFEDRLVSYYMFPDISKEYAKLIKKFAVKNNLKTLHFITGLAHEPEIAYYLQGNLQLLR